MLKYYELKDVLNPQEVLMYLRKSRTDDPSMTVEEVLSKHEGELDEWVEKNLSAPIPEENRYKEIVSGGDSIEDRIEFQKLLKAIESPDIKAVIVRDVSRLGRPDTMEIGRISKIFRYTKTLVITPMRIFDITDESEREMFEQELKRGQFYLEFTKKVLKAGRENSAKSGNFVCSLNPYGYTKTIVMDGKQKCPTLDINEHQANIVRMIFDDYVYENIGTSRIASKLNEMGEPSPRGKLWTADSIRTIIENPLYIGMIRWNQRKALFVVENGQFRKIRPLNKGDDVIYTEGKHDAIISEEIFNLAQQRRKQAHRTCSNKELRNPLASLIYCECGRAMSYRHSTRGNLKYRREPRLVCNGQTICGNGSCSVSEIIDSVAEISRQQIANFEVDVNSDSDNGFHEKRLKSLEKKLSDIAIKELALWEAQLDTENRMPPHVLQALTTKLQKEREDTEDAICKTKELISAPVVRENKRVTFQQALDSLYDDNISIAKKNNLLKACIKRITYHREAPTKVVGKGSGRQWTAPPIGIEVELRA